MASPDPPPEPFLHGASLPAHLDPVGDGLPWFCPACHRGWWIRDRHPRCGACAQTIEARRFAVAGRSGEGWSSNLGALLLFAAWGSLLPLLWLAETLVEGGEAAAHALGGWLPWLVPRAAGWALVALIPVALWLLYRHLDRRHAMRGVVEVLDEGLRVTKSLWTETYEWRDLEGYDASAPEFVVFKRQGERLRRDRSIPTLSHEARAAVLQALEEAQLARLDT